MKAEILVFVSLVCGCQLQRVIINTKSEERAYNFFPLCTNFLEFTVKADNDIHVILTNTYDRSNAYYEVVIGGWGNGKSVIRKNDEEPKVEYIGPIITKNSFQKFWVAINATDESIVVGKEYGKAFMVFNDPNYVKMSLFGISTGFGSPGVWNFHVDLFRCREFC